MKAMIHSSSAHGAARIPFGLPTDGLSIVDKTGVIWAGEFRTRIGEKKVAEFVQSAVDAGAKILEVNLYDSRTQLALTFTESEALAI